MELKDFVKLTLEQIVEGVSEAQKSINARGGIVNPSTLQFQKDGAWNTYQHAMPQEVVFDVGLTTSDKKGSSEGVGVFHYRNAQLAAHFCLKAWRQNMLLFSTQILWTPVIYMSP